MILADNGSTDGTCDAPGRLLRTFGIAAHIFELAPGKSNALKTSRGVTMRCLVSRLESGTSNPRRSPEPSW